MKELLADPSPSCLVDPADPESAVLDRSLGPLALLSLLPLVFVLIGGAGLAFTLRASFREPSAREPAPAMNPRAKRAPSGASPPPPVRARDGFYDLTSTSHPRALFLFLLVFSLVWNGILGVALHALVTGAFDTGSLFAGLFLVPFVLVGAGMLALTLHTFLSIFNPRLRIALSNDRLVPGGEFSLRFAIDRPERVNKLTILLEERETISSWDDDHSHHTKTRVLASTPVVETTQAREIARGERRALLPADAEPVCDGADRKVAWFLKVVGEIPRWPDLAHDFELPVGTGASADQGEF